MHNTHSTVVLMIVIYYSKQKQSKFSEGKGCIEQCLCTRYRVRLRGTPSEQSHSTHCFVWLVLTMCVKFCLIGKLIKDSITEMLMSAPVFLPGESQGWGDLVGCRLWGLTESDMTEVTLQQQPLTKAISNFHKNFRCHVRKVSSINHIVHTV